MIERLSLNDARKKRRQQVPEVPVFTNSFAEIASRSNQNKNLPPQAEPKTKGSSNNNGTPTPSKPTSPTNIINPSPTPTEPNNNGQSTEVTNNNIEVQPPSCPTNKNDLNSLFTQPIGLPIAFPTYSQMTQGNLPPQLLPDPSNHDPMDCDQKNDNIYTQNSSESNNLLTMTQAITNSITLSQEVFDEEL